MKEEIKALALNIGADLVGVAPLERFTGAPTGFNPADISENRSGYGQKDT